jgi:hypothetical protein
MPTTADVVMIARTSKSVWFTKRCSTQHQAGRIGILPTVQRAHYGAVIPRDDLDVWMVVLPRPAMYRTHTRHTGRRCSPPGCRASSTSLAQSPRSGLELPYNGGGKAASLNPISVKKKPKPTCSLA